MQDRLELISTKEFNCNEEMYKIVDFLNKNLSNYDIIFGLTEKSGKHLISIYKENE